MCYVFTKPKSTDFDRIEGVFSSRSAQFKLSNYLTGGLEYLSKNIFTFFVNSSNGTV